MTREQFDKTVFTKGIEIKINDSIYPIIVIDFEDYMFGYKTQQYGELKFTHCEFVELVFKI
jgi:hypothetical protein